MQPLSQTEQVLKAKVLHAVVAYPYCLLYNPRRIYRSQYNIGGMVKNHKGLRYARRLMVCQAGITMLFALISALLSGQLAAKSVILGGLVNLVPNVFFATQVFKFQGARAAKQIVNGFYKGEAVKIILSVVMFALVFKFFSIEPLLFFAAFILAQMVCWFYPFFVNK